MSPKTFSFPTKTRFGAGTLAELPGSLASLGIRRPLVVTDSGLAKTDAFHRLTATLGESGRGREWFVFDGVHPNPIEDDVRLPAALFREQGCDGVIAMGVEALSTPARPRACWPSTRPSRSRSSMTSRQTGRASPP